MYVVLNSYSSVIKCLRYRYNENNNGEFYNEILFVCENVSIVV